MIRPFLTGNGAEDMCITEYNEVETMKLFWEEGHIYRLKFVCATAKVERE